MAVKFIIAMLIIAMFKIKSKAKQFVKLRSLHLMVVPIHVASMVAKFVSVTLIAEAKAMLVSKAK